MENNKRRPGWLLAVAATILLITALAACQTADPGLTDAEPTTAVTDPASGEATLPADEASASPPAATDVPAATPTPYILPGAETTSTGLQYLEESAGSGETPESGELITMHYIISLPDGAELTNTYVNGEPVRTVWGADRLLPGWEEGVGLMKPGGKATMVLPADLAFGEQGYGPIPPGSPIIVEVELLSVEPAPVPTEVAVDELVITDSGLQYYDITEGDGMEAVEKSTVSTHYTLWVKTDQGYDYIDQSPDTLPVSFVLGRGDIVFPGWEEGATGMKVGGKRLLVVPPDLALGSQGNSVIPPESTLVMEIELADVVEPRVATEVDEGDYTTTESGLKIYDLSTGTGENPTAGQTVVVHYTGWLLDGTQFDSSVDRGEPIRFVLGAGNVIPGWDEGVASMKVGGKRQLMIPADLAYGDQGAGGVIPPGATLIFEVELLDIE